jgi:hypothetical protein
MKVRQRNRSLLCLQRGEKHVALVIMFQPFG